MLKNDGPPKYFCPRLLAWRHRFPRHCHLHSMQASDEMKPAYQRCTLLLALAPGIGWLPACAAARSQALEGLGEAPLRALHERMGAEDLLAALCAPKAHVPEGKNRSSRDWMEEAEHLAGEMERFLRCELVPFMAGAAAAPPGGGICPPSTGTKTAFDPEAARPFAQYFSIEPCHSEILQGAAGRLRDRWLNRNDLDGFFAALDPLIPVGNSDPALQAESRRLRAAIHGFKERARKITADAPAWPEHGEEKAGAGGLSSKPLMETAMGCFRGKLGEAGISLGSGVDHTPLLFYALFLGNRRIAPKTLDSHLRGLAARCPGEAGESLSRCWLTSLGYAFPERILTLYDRRGISFLGYSDEDLDRFEKLWSKYDQLLGGEQPLHKVRAVLSPDAGHRADKWDGRFQSVALCGEDHIEHEIRRAEESWMPKEALQAERAKLRSRLAERMEYLFLHEMAHAVDEERLRSERASPGSLGEEWTSIGWTRDGQGRWAARGSPFACGEADFASHGDRTPADLVAEQYGFATFYAATNPAEDFAESVAVSLTDPGRLARVSDSKLAFVRRLLAQGRPFIPPNAKDINSVKIVIKPLDGERDKLSENTRDMLARILRDRTPRLDVSRFIFATEILIDPSSFSHSYPVLTLSARLGLPPGAEAERPEEYRHKLAQLRSLFVHEQIHLAVGPADINANEPLVRLIHRLEERIADLRKLPVPEQLRQRLGEHDAKRSAQLHVVVNWLEFQADKRFFNGDEKEAGRLLLSSGVYQDIYRAVIRHDKAIRQAIEESDCRRLLELVRWSGLEGP